MGTPIEKFIKESHKLYNVKYALTSDRLRKLRYKLRMADIVNTVSKQDETLALDIILSDYKKGSSTLRTASAAPHLGGIPNLRSAGMCPRCSSSMQFVKLANSTEAKYCRNCHVCM